MLRFPFGPPSWTVVAVAVFVCTPARAAEPAACLDLARAFSPKELSSLQINMQLFRVADLGCIQFARTLLGHTQQQGTDAALAILRMHADEGGELLVVSVPDAGEAHELLAGIHDDPGIALQVEAVIPPVSL